MTQDTKIETPEPAFPRNYNADGHNGMSLRDWFAGQALAGLLANSGGPIQRNGMSGWSYTNCGPDTVAREAYVAADAMLAERSKAEGRAS